MTDGLSKTTVFFEQAWRPNVVDSLLSGQERFNDEHGRVVGPVFLHSWGWSWANPEDRGPADGRKINETNLGGRYSFHPAGVNNDLLDGSVHFLTAETDLKILTALDSRNGGEVIQ